MPTIQVLDQGTINKIAAGEVIERPSSVVKELLENAIDANANAVTVEIKEGGISFIRITDNGKGMEREDVPLAFLPHATSKIRNVEDLLHVSSLGFRGEALSSIAAVAQVELITKTSSALTGTRYIIEGGVEKNAEEIGAPSGTTFIIRNLFYNTPARKKFLKSGTTESSYICNIVERIALSHPEISIRLIVNRQNKIHTPGNGLLKDCIYPIFGKDITRNLIEVQAEQEHIKISGYIGKPIVSRGNRNFENYYINGRYIKSKILSHAIEEGYKNFLMQHKYPFTNLHFEISPQLLDVNVHPTKMELKFSEEQMIYEFVVKTIQKALTHKELVPDADFSSHEDKQVKHGKIKEQRTYAGSKPPEPFEQRRITESKASGTLEMHPSTDIVDNFSFAPKVPEKNSTPSPQVLKRSHTLSEAIVDNSRELVPAVFPDSTFVDSPVNNHTVTQTQQMELFDTPVFSKEARSHHRIIGQLFETYWLMEYENKLFIIDQHAAHEKVLFEKTMAAFAKKEHTSQLISPPIILNLSMAEEELLLKFLPQFQELGFEIEPFGDRAYAVRGVPGNLYAISEKELLMDLLDNLCQESDKIKEHLITEKIASMSCKAAVKGNMHLSVQEMDALVEQLMQCDNPYNCPHGRPTIISMSKYELEKKFKRIV